MSSAETLLAGDLSEQREGLDQGEVGAAALVDASLARIASQVQWRSGLPDPR